MTTKNLEWSVYIFVQDPWQRGPASVHKFYGIAKTFFIRVLTCKNYSFIYHIFEFLFWNLITILHQFLFCKYQVPQECLHCCFFATTFNFATFVILRTLFRNFYRFFTSALDFLEKSLLLLVNDN